MGKIQYKKMFYKLLVGLFLVGLVGATLDDPEGVKCGQKKCTIMEYCSPYDQQCRPCLNICDTEDHNHQADLCAKDCQVYLHDQRYVLRSELGQNGILREDPQIQSLWTIIKIISTVTALLTIAVLFFIIRDYVQFKRFRGKFGKIFGKTWQKKTLKNNKIHDDVETGSSKQQQQQQQQQKTLKLSMPTISASITSPTILTTSSSQETNSSNGTPNTTSTPLSKRHPSEDTTLDYAYDNPAMTPSPETVQSRSKRESSF